MQPQEPQFLEDLRFALAMPSPVALIESSSMLAALDSLSPDNDDDDEQQLFNRTPETLHPYPYSFAVLELAPMLVEADDPETNAVLRVWGEMLGDDMLRRRVRNSVSRREHPAWLDALDGTSVTRAMSMGDPFGEETTVMLEVLIHGHTFTMACALQNLGATSLEDAYLIPLSIETAFGDLPAEITARSAQHDLDLAEAKHLVAQAIDSADRMYPPIETDTWPATKPALKWFLRLIPENDPGNDPAHEQPAATRRIEFDPLEEDEKAAEREAFTRAFAASPEGRALPSRVLDEAGLLFEFQHNYGTGNALRWGPMFVESLMLDLYPRKLAAPDRILLQLPQLLTAVVTWANPQSGIPAEATSAVLKLIRDLTPQYRDLVTSGNATPFPFGAGALSDPNFLESVGLGSLMSEPTPGFGAAPEAGADSDTVEPFDDSQLTAYLMTIPLELRYVFRRASSADVTLGEDSLVDFLIEKFPSDQPLYSPELMKEYSQITLAREVGGADVLAALGAAPLPPPSVDEALARYDVPDDVRPRLQQVGALIMDRGGQLFEDTELVTAALGVLARSAASDPALFRRRSKNENTAAAACWIAAAINDWLDPQGGTGQTAKAIGAAFGMKTSPRTRAEALVRAMGAHVYIMSGEFFLGDAGLLTSGLREIIIDTRDALRR